MNGFNQFLMDDGINSSVVKLARLHDSKAKGRARGSPTAYDLWDENNGGLELYLSLQHKEKFKVGGYVAAVVVTPKKETLFVGIYRVIEYGHTASGVIDPMWPKLTPSKCYRLKNTEFLSDFVGKLIIDWGSAKIQWVQYVHKQDKPIARIRK